MTDVPHRPARRNTSGLARDLELLELLGSAESARADGLGVVRLAELSGRDKGVVSRSLATLADSGLAERDPLTRAYRLGPRLYALAAHTRETRLTSVARPILRRIANETRETASLNVLRGGHVLTVLSELSPHEFRATGWEGVTTSAWRTPSGRALLSQWDDTALREWFVEHADETPIVGRADRSVIASPFAVVQDPSPASDHVRDLTTLLAEVARVRELGYAPSVEELERGIVAASAPIIDFTGSVVAAVNISAPISRVGADPVPLGTYIARVGAEISASLGAQVGDASV
ncbi:MAG: IclR family transcriptional regulator [Microbacterium sp.]